MPDYQNGKIYKITSGDLTYIGSTCEPTLARRLAGHVSGYKRFQNGKGYNVTSFQLIETGQYEITLVELYPCGSKDELHARERFHIENMICVNKHIPCRTVKEWFNDNAEHIKEHQKAYQEANADKIKEQHKAYIEVNADNIKEQKKAYYEANADKIKAYYEANADKIKEQKKAYYEANTDKIKKRQKANREAKKAIKPKI